MKEEMPPLPSVVVLIETYWNVNNAVLPLFEGYSYSINRNILECKSILLNQINLCLSY